MKAVDTIVDLVKEGSGNIMVFGIGGGGDIVSAAVLASALERYGFKSFIGSIVWERFLVDPVPGPVGLKELVGIDIIGDYSGVIMDKVHVLRGGRRITPQVYLVSKATGKPVYIVDIKYGVKGYVKGLQELMDYLGIDFFIAIDVGGDVLAEGWEEELWSPLADSLGLAAFNYFKNSMLAVHGIGGDGELPPNRILERIALLCKLGGCLGARGLTHRDAVFLEKILSIAHSEASLIPLLAFRGYYGYYPIRAGTREVLVTPVQSITFFLDLHKAYDISPLARIVDKTSSIEEARDKLNKACIYTELDLEYDLQPYIDKIDKPGIIIKTRLEGMKRIKQQCR